MNIGELREKIKDLPDDMLLILNRNQDDRLIVATAWVGEYDQNLTENYIKGLFFGYEYEMENKGE